MPTLEGGAIQRQTLQELKATHRRLFPEEGALELMLVHPLETLPSTHTHTLTTPCLSILNTHQWLR